MKPLERGGIPAPDGSQDVVLVQFGADTTYGGMPGSGNTIVYGRFDTTLNCPGGESACEAVFFNLRRLRPGSEIQVFWEQKVYSYMVSLVCSIPKQAPFDPVVEKTANERLTLMTEAGQFDRDKRTYSHTLLVIAEPTRSPNLQCPRSDRGDSGELGASRFIALDQSTETRIGGPN
jgi:hypothetical protein